MSKNYLVAVNFLMREEVPNFPYLKAVNRPGLDYLLRMRVCSGLNLNRKSAFLLWLDDDVRYLKIVAMGAVTVC